MAAIIIRGEKKDRVDYAIFYLKCIILTLRDLNLLVDFWEFYHKTKIVSSNRLSKNVNLCCVVL